MNAHVPLRRADLVPFADLGTSVHEADIGTSGRRFMLTRNNIERTIHVELDQRTTLAWPGSPNQSFSSPATMLAGTEFGDLDRWSHNQAYLFRQSEASGEPLPVQGRLRIAEGNSGQGDADLDVSQLDASLIKRRSSLAVDASLVLVVDGPAGSGKTTLIQELAHRHAKTWRNEPKPLVLHVESRGRVLQNLRDLLAFSLQTLRVAVTYDQIVPLVRHGLVLLAIDGFDELADPNGYQTAWSQLNELVMDTRGRATLILAGRETFISRARVASALSQYKPDTDQMPLYTLKEVQPQTAKDWLECRGWTKESLSKSNVAPIFEEGSYALRPVFLSQFHELKDQIQIQDQIVPDLLSFLVERMLDREATKFTQDIDESQSKKLRNFVNLLLQEIARDLAENQTNTIPNESLRWIAEFTASDLFGLDFVNVLSSRAQNVAFLTPDARVEHTRFAHEQVSIHFLAQECFRAITAGEVPKYVRRNIFGRETLEGFARVAGTLDIEQAGGFVTACRHQFGTTSDVDRSRQNLVALSILVACVAEIPSEEPLFFENVDLGEILIPADAAPITFSNAVIRTLYARGVDLTNISWKNTDVVTLFANKSTVVDDGFPSPTVVELPDETLRTPSEIEAWRRPVIPSSTSNQLPVPELDLLRRIDRYRPFWLREDLDTADRSARKIITDEHWPRVRRVLSEHGLMEERTVSAAGPPSRFIHFRRFGSGFADNSQILSSLETE